LGTLVTKRSISPGSRARASHSMPGTGRWMDGYQSIDARTSFDDPFSPSTAIAQSRF
jgi:hypothetical protein